MEYVYRGVLLTAIIVLYFRQSFYRGYFRQKQINAGKDPDTVLREQFPRLWRVM